MGIEQAIETLNNKNERPAILALTLKHGESISILGGLIEIEVNLTYHPSRPMLKFKAPKFVRIFRIKKQ
jgi:sRNA-binding carbon storage regulator CsrA